MKKKIIPVCVLVCMILAAVILLLTNKNRTDIQEESGQEVQFDEETSTYTLTLEYDDRYSVDDFAEGYFVVSIYDEEAVSYQVEGGEATETPDTSVISLEDGSDTELIADGVGSAVMKIAPESLQGEISESNISDYEDYVITVEVTVEPAQLTLMFVAGQSNAEGACSSYTGYELSETVACEDGTVYSTYAPSSEETGEKVTGLTFSQAGTYLDAEDIVAGSLTSDTALSGNTLEYALNTLTESGSGKTGLDGALAWEWNLLTGDKVWVVNASWSGLSITYWQEGKNIYSHTAEVFSLAEQTYEAEIAAGHYTEGEILLFWLQGESDYTMETETYYSYFTALCENFKEDLDLDAVGIIMVRSSCGEYDNTDELRMSGPRIAQYLAGQDEDLSYVYVVSNVNEQWISDEGVEEYFAQAYPEGYITCPKRDSSEKYASSLPETMDEIHADIHYSQTAHNENGITAAKGMYAALYGSDEEITAEWRTENGLGISSLILGIDEEADLIAAADPVYCGKDITYEITGDCVSYDSDTAVITGLSEGSAYIKAYADGECLCELEITVVETALNGLCYDDELGWVYYSHSVIDYTYTGLVENDYGWWYVTDGVIDYSYTGMVKNEYGWWYVADGMIDFTYTGLAENDYGTWYMENGLLTYYTGTVTIDGVTYTVENGQVIS